MNKMNCPFHKGDDTPSLHLYYNTNRYYCFGCGASGKLNKLLKTEYLPPPKKPYIEDVAASIAKIETLPKKMIRGFELPYDERGYYLVWPDKSYYLKRYWDGDSSNKYRGPSGHSRPLLTFNISDNSAGGSVFIVEGEFNAASLGECGYRVLTPGSAGNFYSRSYNHNLPIYQRFDKIYVVVDADKAGAIAAIELKAKLSDKDVKIILMEQDANDILVNHGKEKLRQVIQERMEMSERVQNDKRTVPAPGSSATEHEGRE